MKNHSLKIEIGAFLTILFLLIVPSLLPRLSADESNLFIQWNFPCAQIILGIFAFLIFIFFCDDYKKISFIKFPALLTVGFLFFVALVIKYISVKINPSADDFNILLPDSFVKWVFCILNFLFAAFYEEIIYRFYFIDALKKLLSAKFNNKAVSCLCEFAGVLIFAFSHYYLGWLAVLNACFGHVILRFCYKRNDCIYPCVTAHFIYNILSLLVL